VATGKGRVADEVAPRLMMTNPVMEGLGNAKTIRNNNSSRFGKHFDIQFGNGGNVR
jgi:myosin heavy subunit